MSLLPRLRRRLNTRTAAFAATAGIVLAVAGAPAAYADDPCKAVTNCKHPGPADDSGCEAPTPTNPKFGWATEPRNPSTADPFAKGATVSITEVYGLGAYTWTTCDMGSGLTPGAIVSRINASMNNSVSNGWMTNTKYGLSAADAAGTYAFNDDTWRRWLDPIVEQMNAKVMGLFWIPGRPGGQPWADVIVAIGALMLVGNARTANVGFVFGALCMTGAIAGAAMMVMGKPTWFASLPDRVIPSVIGTINYNINGNTGTGGDGVKGGLIGNAADNMLWPTWLEGEFGSSTSAVAKKWGAACFKAKSLSWAEYDIVSADPNVKGKAIIDGKAKQWEACAAGVKHDDPNIAYKVMTGADYDTRSDAGVRAFWLGVAGNPALVITLGAVLLAEMAARYWVVGNGIVSLVGLTHKGHDKVIGYWKMFGALFVNVAVLGVITSLAVVAYGLILTPNNPMPQGLQTALLLVTSSLVFALEVGMVKVWRLAAMKNPTGAVGKRGRRLRRAAWRTTRGAGLLWWGSRKVGDLDHDWHNSGPEIRSARDPKRYNGGPQDPESMAPPPQAAPREHVPHRPATGRELPVGSLAPAGTAGPTVTATAHNIPRPAVAGTGAGTGLAARSTDTEGWLPEAEWTPPEQASVPQPPEFQRGYQRYGEPGTGGENVVIWKPSESDFDDADTGDSHAAGNGGHTGSADWPSRRGRARRVLVDE